MGFKERKEIFLHKVPLQVKTPQLWHVLRSDVELSFFTVRVQVTEFAILVANETEAGQVVTVLEEVVLEPGHVQLKDDESVGVDVHHLVSRMDLKMEALELGQELRGHSQSKLCTIASQLP